MSRASHTFRDGRGLYTPAEAAAYLRISGKTLQRYVREGAIRYIETGRSATRRRPAFDRSDLNEFIADQDRQLVYVVGFGVYVKIGYTTQFKNRLDGLQTGIPEKLTVYGTIKGGGLGTEAALHKRFAAYRLSGEWFRKAGALAAWIEAGCKR